MTEPLNQQELQMIKENRDVRATLAKQSHYWFFSLYLGGIRPISLCTIS